MTVPQHPPWLRFQAYLVGLPKTGSTSVATVFSNYRTGHEWGLMDLVGPGIDWRRGDLDDAAFLRATGRRFVPASLEMDSTTCHHLYAGLLRDTFPKAVFVHTVRDVQSWTTSLLDMVLRKRLARRELDIPYSAWERRYFAFISDNAYELDPESDADDRAAIPALMRYWVAHVTEICSTLPPDRTLLLRTRDIPHRLDALAALTGVPVGSLRADRAHTNRAPMALDRFVAFDSDEVRDAYQRHCAELMADLFPDEHAAWTTSAPRPQPTEWPAYVDALRGWVVDAIRAYGPPAAR
jgi:hypothetical protein